MESSIMLWTIFFLQMPHTVTSFSGCAVVGICCLQNTIPISIVFLYSCDMVQQLANNFSPPKMPQAARADTSWSLAIIVFHFLTCYFSKLDHAACVFNAIGSCGNIKITKDSGPVTGCRIVDMVIGQNNVSWSLSFKSKLILSFTYWNSKYSRSITTH